MANEEHLARLKQGFVSVLTRARQALTLGAAYVYARGRTWIAERQVQEGIRHISQRVMARLCSTPWQELTRRYLPLLVGLSVVLLPFVLWKFPQWYATSWDKLTDPKDIAKLESDTRTAMVQALGGIALLTGLLFTWRNLRMTEQNSRHTLDLSRKGQINDRFIKAIEQLGAVDQGGGKKLEVRLGGIYALEQVGKDSPDDHHWPIMEILTAYVRENASWKEEEQPSQEDIVPSETQPTQSNQSPPKLATDIQAILTVVGRRTRTYGKGEVQPLHLGNTDLRGVLLPGAHLEGGFLAKAHLEGADLRVAQLEGVNLVRAHLEGADLLSAQLKGAFLMGAHLERAWLSEAHLEGAKLGGAQLEGAFLVGVHLEGADAGGAQLERANLYEAYLDRAILIGAHFEGANLHAAHLEGANLHTAYLEGADLLEAQMKGADLWEARLQGAKNLTVE
jgi:uncharacterized protein YjbI with pentapeptide repeats